jgi:hypothetical protein
MDRRLRSLADLEVVGAERNTETKLVRHPARR